jgi:hypothetical protein
MLTAESSYPVITSSPGAWEDRIVCLCPEDWDGDSVEYEQMLEFEEAGGYPGFSLEYELVPGVDPVQSGGNLFRYLVGVSYTADVELPWFPTDGGAIAPFEGGDATHGSRGDWPLPPDATVLTFSLAGVDAAGFADHDNPAGDLVVDVTRGTAVWRPAEAGSGR